IYYDQLIQDHTKSKFLQTALLKSIDSKVRNYLGPQYDGTGLEDAKKQIKQALNEFPEKSPENEQKLYRTLDLIREEEAKRAYEFAEHYLWTRNIAGAEYYFGMIPVKWPKSPYADKAKEKLALLAKMPRKETLPSQIMTRPGAADPFGSGIGSANPG